MRHRDRDLLQRQQALLRRSQQLRLSLAEDAQVLERPLALADRVGAAVRWLYHHPQWPVGVLAAMAVLRPRRALRWGGRVWWAWRTYRKTLRLLGSSQ